jgi:hypothetical protein
VFALAGQAGLFARGDAQASVVVGTASTRTTTGCLASGFGLSPLVGVAGLASLSGGAPALTGAPWHLEIR